MLTKTNPRNCQQCNSSLVLISKETIQVEGSRFFQTNTVYRCTNVTCQAEKDKEAKKRLQQRKEKEISDKKRAEKIQEKRKQALALKGGQS